ncbi:MAG: DUF3300 domain-containing protein [Nitrospirota bacterium]|nr:DUF3300 domain-containing protein [Nitrospirota bacterium]
MKACIICVLTPLLVPLLSWSLVFAQQEMPPPQETPPEQDTLQPDSPSPPQTAPRQTRPAFTQQELDQMLAPIALYPDSLLSQILMASTYPLEIVEASRWSKANPNLKGEKAVQAVAEDAWDPSVKSLVAFPQILMMMDEKLNWTERLGDAFLAQQQEVMDTVQNLRQKASEAGNLKSNDQIRVEQQGQSIVVEPANPQVVYVPYYNPMVMYGPWWWPAYPPVYWGPWPGYFYGPRFGVGFAWGIGIGIGPGFFFGGFNWPYRHVNIANANNFYHHSVNVNRGTVWAHDPVHRRGVPYRDVALRQQFTRMSASPEARRQFRGHDSSSFVGRSSFGNRQESRSGSPGRSNMPGGSRSDMRSAPSRPIVPNRISPRFEQRPHAFEGVGQGAAERNFSARGHASWQGFASPPSGGFRGGGGGGSHQPSGGSHGGGGGSSHHR